MLIAVLCADILLYSAPIYTCKGVVKTSKAHITTIKRTGMQPDKPGAQGPQQQLLRFLQQYAVDLLPDFENQKAEPHLGASHPRRCGDP